MFDKCSWIFLIRSDALRGVLDRRILRLLRICGFHRLTLWKEETQKKGKKRRGEKKEKDFIFWICAALTRSCWVRPSAQFLLALAEQSAVCTFFSLFPAGLAALLRSAGFFYGVVFFARMTLARSAFHSFQIGFKRCTSWNPIWNQYGGTRANLVKLEDYCKMNL